MNNTSPIKATVAKTNLWLHELRDDLGVEDSQIAYRALRAVLHALRDRIGIEVSAHLSAQLPMLVRGMFYEGWDPTQTPMRLSLAEFLDRIERDGMFKGTSEAEDAARAVTRLLWRHLGEGTMTHVVEILPNEYATVM